ncbi:phosphatase PAP2 family protein [Nocardioides sp. MAHUQ-72]|uniref:phosphatase PAP2 family protein n=1 Tax=unclassified Nocardioides TaxID=2615069 RepID=UPI0036173CBC
MTATSRTKLPWVLGQAGWIVLGLVVYFRVRGLTDASRDVALAHGRDIVAFEKDLGLHVEAAFQRPVESSEAAEAVANWIYIWGHWPVIIATMVWLAWRHRPYFLRLRDGMLVSGAMGMVVFVTYPVAPPRLLGLGLVDTVTESSNSYRYLQPPAFVDQYAAMPSLHSGWDLLVGIAIYGAATSRVLKVVGCAMPVLMAVAVVATANHYVVDVVAGIALALVGHVCALALERRRDRRGREPA